MTRPAGPGVDGNDALHGLARLSADLADAVRRADVGAMETVTAAIDQRLTALLAGGRPAALLGDIRPSDDVVQRLRETDQTVLAAAHALLGLLDEEVAFLYGLDGPGGGYPSADGGPVARPAAGRQIDTRA